MDPNCNLKSSFPLNFPHGSPSQPSSPFPVDFPFDEGFPQFQLDFPMAAESGGAEPDEFACLQENPNFPFLYKTFDLVEDPSLNSIISWGENGDTFVVWDPAYLAMIVLPRYFKHGNFASFVRQLNTYGFSKIDPNKWEFANEFFLQGCRHLLKKIHRSKSSPQQVASEESGPEMERRLELEKLSAEKSVIMQEMAVIQQQQRQTGEYMKTVKRKLEASEKRSKKMLSFLLKAVRNPKFVESVVKMKKQSLRRTRKKVVKQKTQEQVSSLPFQTEQVEAQELMTSAPIQNPENGEFSSNGYLGTDKGFAELFSSI